MARSRFRLLGRFRIRRVPLDANQFKEMGLAKPLGSMGGVDMFSVVRSLCIRSFSPRIEIRLGLGPDWFARLQHDILPMWQPNLHHP